jgi:hypothetical protein
MRSAHCDERQTAIIGPLYLRNLNWPTGQTTLAAHAEQTQASKDAAAQQALG